MALATGFLIGRSKESREYQLFTGLWKFHRKYFFELLRVGSPLGGIYCIEVALFTVMAFMMGHFGVDALAAHQVAVQCFVFALTVIFGLSQGTRRLEWDTKQGGRIERH